VQGDLSPFRCSNFFFSTPVLSPGLFLLRISPLAVVGLLTFRFFLQRPPQVHIFAYPLRLKLSQQVTVHVGAFLRLPNGLPLLFPLNGCFLLPCMFLYPLLPGHHTWIFLCVFPVGSPISHASVLFFFSSVLVRYVRSPPPSDPLSPSFSPVSSFVYWLPNASELFSVFFWVFIISLRYLMGFFFSFYSLSSLP